MLNVNSLKYLIKLTIFSFVLAGMLFGGRVFADRYIWSTPSDVVFGPSGGWHVVSLAANSIGYASKNNSLYRSTSYGSTWSLQYNFDRRITGIATNEDGSFVLVSTDDPDENMDGQLYVSDTSGASFESIGINADWRGVSMSADGAYQYAVYEQELAGTYLYRSTDYGQSFSGGSIYESLFTKVTSSHDGRFVFIGVAPSDSNGTEGVVLMSDDYGASISFGNTYNYGSRIVDIDSNADGTILLVTPETGSPALVNQGALSAYVSISGSWKAGTISGDGSRIALVNTFDEIYVSVDSGASFSKEYSISESTDSIRNDISMSSNGQYIIVGSSDYYLAQAYFDPTPPVISNITSTNANGTYGVGTSIVITATTDEWVYNSSNISLSLETGVTDRNCNITFATASSTGSCTYVVQAGDETSDLSVKAITGILYDQNLNVRNSFSSYTGLLASNKNIVIYTTVPSTSFVTPTNGTYASGTIDLSMTVTGQAAGYLFRVDSTDIGVEGGTPSVSFDTTEVSDGLHTLYAIVRDILGTYASSSISITVDNTAPAVSITEPTSGATVSGVIDFTASSSDVTSDVASVQLIASTTASVDILANDTMSPYNVSIDTTDYDDGVLELYAVSTDSTGNKATSTISVNINNTSPVSTPTPIVGQTGGGGAAVSFWQAPVSNVKNVPEVPLFPLTNPTPQNNTVPQVARSLTPTQLAAITFGTRNLSVGTVGAEVKKLQVLLNKLGYTVAPRGAGSRGRETTVFGPATKQALIKFQKDMDIKPASGTLGPLTKALILKLHR